MDPQVYTLLTRNYKSYSPPVKPLVVLQALFLSLTCTVGSQNPQFTEEEIKCQREEIAPWPSGPHKHRVTEGTESADTPMTRGLSTRS